MAHEVSEVKVKIPTQAELAKVKVDEQGLTPSQIADLMVLLAKDLKKEVKEGAKKVKKAAVPEGEEKPKKEKNTWFKFLDHVRAKVKELKAEVKLVATEPTQFASYLKEASLYPQENVSDEVLSAKFDEWYAIPKDERPKKAKAEPKVKETKVKAVAATPTPTPTSAPVPVPKPKAKKPTAEEVVVKPAEGVFLPQKVKGTKYLTCSYDGDDLIYLYNEAQEYVGAYDPKVKELDQTVADPCA